MGRSPNANTTKGRRVGDPGSGARTSGGDRAIEAILYDLQAEGRITRDQALDAIDAFEKGGYEDFKDALSKSNSLENSAIANLWKYSMSPEQAQIDYGGYIGDVDSEAAKAYADEASRAAQYDTLGKLKGWTTPEMTAEERFLQAKFRSAEERDMRAAREAALRDLESRGVRSGASEMAALLGAQGVTSQNRMLGDLGAQANAVQRALQATEAYGQQADTLSQQTFQERFDTGSAADSVAKFNNQLRTDYQRDKARFNLDQQDSRFKRRETLTDKRIAQASNQADRAGQVADLGYKNTALRTATLTGNNPVLEGLKIALGHEEAETAKKELGKEKPKTLWDEITSSLGL